MKLKKLWEILNVGVVNDQRTIINNSENHFKQ